MEYIKAWPELWVSTDHLSEEKKEEGKEIRACCCYRNQNKLFSYYIKLNYSNLKISLY